uniref:Uncharacterized protein n=1 Tax=Crocodylus porosus TaxID=8502 RepID=A0A7M4EQN4_CROPO
MDNCRTGAVVIDTGTGCCKAGFAGQQSPKSVLGSWVGRPTEQSFKTKSACIELKCIWDY